MTKYITAQQAHHNGVALERKEREIRKELASGAKVRYSYQGKSYALTTPESREEMTRLQNVLALTTSDKTRIAITNLFRSLCGEGNTFVVEGTQYTCSRMGYII